MKFNFFFLKEELKKTNAQVLQKKEPFFATHKERKKKMKNKTLDEKKYLSPHTSEGFRTKEILCVLFLIELLSIAGLIWHYFATFL